MLYHFVLNNFECLLPSIEINLTILTTIFSNNSSLFTSFSFFGLNILFIYYADHRCIVSVHLPCEILLLCRGVSYRTSYCGAFVVTFIVGIVFEIVVCHSLRLYPPPALSTASIDIRAPPVVSKTTVYDLSALIIIWLSKQVGELIDVRDF